jgi:hypothetical protein
MGRFAQLRRILDQLRALYRSYNEIQRELDLRSGEPSAVSDAERNVLENELKDIAKEIEQQGKKLDEVSQKYFREPLLEANREWLGTPPNRRVPYSELVKRFEGEGEMGPRTIQHYAGSTFRIAGESQLVEYLPQESIVRAILSHNDANQGVNELPASDKITAVPEAKDPVSRPGQSPAAPSRNQAILERSSAALFTVALAETGYRWFRGEPGATAGLASLALGVLIPLGASWSAYANARKRGVEEVAARLTGARWGTRVATGIAGAFAAMSLFETGQAWSEYRRADESIARLPTGNSPERAALEKQRAEAKLKGIFGVVNSVLGVGGAIAIGRRSGLTAFATGALALGSEWVERSLSGPQPSTADQAANEAANAPKAAGQVESWRANLALKRRPDDLGAVTV